jgi:hypothetical protein
MSYIDLAHADWRLVQRTGPEVAVGWGYLSMLPAYGWPTLARPRLIQRAMRQMRMCVRTAVMDVYASLPTRSLIGLTSCWLGPASTDGSSVRAGLARLTAAGQYLFTAAAK